MSCSCIRASKSYNCSRVVQQSYNFTELLISHELVPELSHVLVQELHSINILDTELHSSHVHTSTMSKLQSSHVLVQELHSSHTLDKSCTAIMYILVQCTELHSSHVHTCTMYRAAQQSCRYLYNVQSCTAVMDLCQSCTLAMYLCKSSRAVTDILEMSCTAVMHLSKSCTPVNAFLPGLYIIHSVVP